MILSQRLRHGKTGSPKGAARIVGDALATLRRTGAAGQGRPLLRADSAFYGHATIGTAIKAGADVSVTVRIDPAVKAAIATIEDHEWTKIEYTDAIRDEATGQWISSAEVAEVPFTAFRTRKKTERVTWRLAVRRIPDLNPRKVEQPALFDTFRPHAFFTTTSADERRPGTSADARAGRERTERPQTRLRPGGSVAGGDSGEGPHTAA